MKKEFIVAAELVHSTLRFKTNCYRDGKIIPANQLVAIDDDASSAFAAAKVFYEIRKEYGYCPKVLCVGGKGPMSKYTHKNSEAELLAYVLQQLGINRCQIEILGNGRNTRENILAVAQVTPEETTTIWCCTQRLSLRLERTQVQQAPQLKSYYYVLEQTIDDVMKLYNGKGLCHGEMLLHELASILNRCETYAGTFQKPLDFEVSSEVREAAKKLENNFRLKLPKKTLKSYWQFIKLYIAILLNKKAMKQELNDTIEQVANQLKNEGLVGSGDIILGKRLYRNEVGLWSSANY